MAALDRSSIPAGQSFLLAFARRLKQERHEALEQVLGRIVFDLMDERWCWQVGQAELFLVDSKEV